MDTIKVKFKNGDSKGFSLLPDISSDKFDEFIWKGGSNDLEYERYKQENNMVELSDFNSQSTNDIILVVEQEWRGRVLKFKCFYDSENDSDFDEGEYFKK